MKSKILVLGLVLLMVAFSAVFLSDYFIDRKEVKIDGRYSVVYIDGEYHLMHRQGPGYGLIVPNILNVYLRQGDVIAVSTTDGSRFINTGYKGIGPAADGTYYYHVKDDGVQEIGKEDFFKNKNLYALVWRVERQR